MDGDGYVYAQELRNGPTEYLGIFDGCSTTLLLAHQYVFWRSNMFVLFCVLSCF